MCCGCFLLSGSYMYSCKFHSRLQLYTPVSFVQISLNVSSEVCQTAAGVSFDLFSKGFV
jgi:hypothetical protein